MNPYVNHSPQILTDKTTKANFYANAGSKYRKTPNLTLSSVIDQVNPQDQQGSFSHQQTPKIGSNTSVTPPKIQTSQIHVKNADIKGFNVENENLVKVSDLVLHGKNIKFIPYEMLELKKFKKENFEFGTKLGKGKFGDVYLAREKKTNFIVAIKVLDKASIRQMKAQKQVIREIKIHSYLNHRNVIKLYGVFHDEKKVYMVMEYAPDGELYKELKSDVKFFSQKKFQNEKIILFYELF